MKTKAPTPHSSSHSIKLQVPTAWHALTDQQLHHIARLQTNPQLTPTHRRLLFLLSLLPTSHSRPLQLLSLDPSQIADALPLLDFIEQPPTTPRRPLHLYPSSPSALPADLLGVPFSTYLQIENYYRAIIDTDNPEAYQMAAALLYPSTQKKHTAAPPPLNPSQRYIILLWLVSLHTHLADLFPDLFQPSNPHAAPPSARDIMTAEIRTLTQGDVTRTPAVLQTETHTALTELNYRAQEAREAQKMMKHT